MNKKRAIIITIPFIVMIFTICAVNLIKPDAQMSEAENRNLQQKPTVEDIKNKQFGTVYENYYTDQFALRDEMLKLKTYIDIKSKKSNVKGYYISEDGWVLEEPVIDIGDEQMDYLAGIINEYAKKLNEKGKDIYYISAAHKVNVLSHKLPSYVDKNCSIENKNRLLERLDKNTVKTIDLTDYFLNNLEKSKLETMYFKTDHHWNSIGGYEAVKHIANVIGKDNNQDINLKDDDYETVYIPNKKFLGSYNLNLYEMMSKDEKVPYVQLKKAKEKEYYLNNGKEFVKVGQKDIFAYYVHEKELTHAGAYTMDDLNYKIVNKSPLIDKKVLIYRDSYHSATSWMISDIFREVEVVDGRHQQKFGTTTKDVAENTEADIVIFMYNDLSFKDMINQLDC